MELSERMRGERIDMILSNGHVLQIRLGNGHEFNIIWVDDNGNPVKGKPVLTNNGWRLKANASQIVTGVSQQLPARQGMG